MLESAALFREMTPLSILLRLVLTVVCGGLIGLEREYKRRPAGFRTHILICLGACMTTMTSQYLAMVQAQPVDLSRLGAQVVAGVGFIGAGTIIVTRQQRVKGLTTAAGLWACAILGLTIGAGFVESAVLFAMLVLLAELLFVKLEYRLLKNSQEQILYVEYAQAACLEALLAYFREKQIRVGSMEITRGEGEAQQKGNAIFYIKLNRNHHAAALQQGIASLPGVLSVVEL